MAEPYDTMLERYETLAEVGATTARIIGVAGRSDYAIGDQFKVDWGTTENTADTTISGDLMSGKSKGDVVSCSLTGLPANAPFWYRVSFEFDGVEYPGGWNKAYTLPAATATVLIQNFSDTHLLESINGAQTARLQSVSQTVANMASDEAAMAVPTLRSSTGDCVPFAKANSSSIIFPINEDGSTISGSNTYYAQSLTDTRRDCRLFKGYFGTLFRSSMFLRTQGNHDGGQHWHYSANNSGHNDVATYSYQAFNEHFGNIASSSGFTGNANGLWGTIRFGPVLCCYMNPYPDTQLSSSAASSTPVMPDSNNDWTLGQTQWDHFFNASTGTIRTADPNVTPFIVIHIHNMLGASTVPVILKRYAWGGARHVAESKALGAGQVFETGPGNGWPNPYGYTGEHATHGLHRALKEFAAQRGIQVLVLYGHAHFYAREPVEGITYVLCARTAGSSSGLGNYGFRQDGGWWTGTAWTNTDPNAVFLSNSGHLNILASPKKMTVQYKRSIVTGQTASDGINTNNAIADEFTLYAESNTVRLNSPSKRRLKSEAESIRSHNVSKSAKRRMVVSV